MKLLPVLGAAAFMLNPLLPVVADAQSRLVPVCGSGKNLIYHTLDTGSKSPYESPVCCSKPCHFSRLRKGISDAAQDENDGV